MTVSVKGVRRKTSKVLCTLWIVVMAVSLTALPQGGVALAQNADTQNSLPLSPIEKAEKDGTALRMSLKDLTKLALQNNLDIAISDTNEELYNQKVIQAYGPYDPALNIGLGYNSSKRPNTNIATAAAGGASVTNNALWNFQFTQNIPTGGGITASWNTNRNDSNQGFYLFSPQYNANLSVQFTQPLRRNFRIDQYRSTIKLANLDIKTNDSQFKQKVTDTIATIQGQYWDLVGAIRDYEIKRQSVELAQITLRDNKKKVEIGTLAPIGITEAQADMASRQVDLITAEETIYSAENALRALISNDRNGEIWKQTIVPIETPDFQEYKVDLQLAIDTALQTRPELEQIDIKTNQYDINYALNKNLKKWQFDLVGGFGSVGIVGPPDAMFSAYRSLFADGYLNWSVQFNLQIPLKNRTVDSQLAQIKVQKRQNLMTRKMTEQQIQVDVRNAVQHIETSKQQVQTARIARQLAKEQLDGEEKRFQAGLSQNFLVLDRQRALASAEGVELQSLITYKKALIAVQKSMYTLLESNDFAIAKTSSGNVPNLK